MRFGVILYLSENFVTALTSGLISSIFATFFIWVLYKFFNGVVVPYYQETVYQGVIIEGKWRNEINNPNSKRGAEGTLELRQKGGKVHGELILKNVREGQKDFTIIYSIEGEIRNNLVFLYGKPKNRKKFSFVSGLFIIKNGGNVLLGASLGTDNYTGEIFASQNVEWFREN